MKLEDFEQLAVDALKNGHYEAAACLYLGLYEISKLKSNTDICLTCPYRVTGIGQSPVEPFTITYRDSTGQYETTVQAQGGHNV